MKREKPILVILGNPPYNSFAGMAVGEERDLSDAYRTVKDPTLRPPEGQGLNDLYVRFFRMAERRIAEKTGRGIISFISNYSWLDGLSFPGMRERYLEAFDVIRIDCLNGDKYKTGKTTPDGKPDPSVFSTEHNHEGIQIGTAIATLIRKGDHKPTKCVGYRDLWGIAKREELADTAEQQPEKLYSYFIPLKELGLPFIEGYVDKDYVTWPRLNDLFPTLISGVQTKRDNFLVSIDRDELETRIETYFDDSISHDDFRARFPRAMVQTARYYPIQTREYLVKRGILADHIVKYCYRPFDVRWIYWEPETKLLGEKSPSFFPNVFDGNIWIEAREKQTKENFDRGYVTPRLADNFGSGFSSFFPAYLLDEADGSQKPNLSGSVARLIGSFGLTVDNLFSHVAAILRSPDYQCANVGALRLDWPRVPLPKKRDALMVSSKLGSKLIDLLNPETPVQGVTTGALRSELRQLGVPCKEGSSSLSEQDFSLTVGWGSVQGAGIVMPGRGRIKERNYRDDEVAAFLAASESLNLSDDKIFDLLGETTFDVYLNESAYWANVPGNVWSFALSGYQVVKKWLSYREKNVLGRDLKPDEVAYVSDMVRRIAAILLLGPGLDANYEAAKTDAVSWKDGRPVA